MAKEGGEGGNGEKVVGAEEVGDGLRRAERWAMLRGAGGDEGDGLDTGDDEGEDAGPGGDDGEGAGGWRRRRRQGRVTMTGMAAGKDGVRVSSGRPEGREGREKSGAVGNLDTVLVDKKRDRAPCPVRCDCLPRIFISFLRRGTTEKSARPPPDDNAASFRFFLPFSFYPFSGRKRRLFIPAHLLIEATLHSPAPVATT